MTDAKVEQILKDMPPPKVQWRQPVIIATFGLPGAGKTTIAALLSQRYPFIVLSTDAIRLKYDFTSGPETLEAMQLVARHYLADGHNVIFDGIHMMRASRAAMRTFSASCNALIHFIYVKADTDTLKARLAERRANPEETTKAGKFVITDDHFARIAQYFEDPEGEADVTQVDTTSGNQSVEAQLALLMGELDKLL